MTTEPATPLEGEDTAPLDVEDIPTPKSAAAAKAKPAPAPKVRKAPKDAVVGGGDTDPVIYSRVTPEGRKKTRKSLTVHHLQRRLAWLGHAQAASDMDGAYGALTASAVADWQREREYIVTGDLTHEQFLEVFADDPNVTATVDIPVFD